MVAAEAESDSVPVTTNPCTPIFSHPELVLVALVSFLRLERGPSFILCVNAGFLFLP